MSGLHEKRRVAAWNLGRYHSICLKTQKSNKTCAKSVGSRTPKVNGDL